MDQIAMDKNEIDQIVNFNKVATFMTKDSDLWITGRYEKLQLINLLALQQRLSDLEQEIDAIVKYERRHERREACPPPKRSFQTILDDLEKSMKAYGKVTIYYVAMKLTRDAGDAISILATIRRAESPTQHIVQYLRDFAPFSSVITNLKPRLSTEDPTAHLFSIATSRRGWLHRFVGKHERLSRFFREVRNPLSLSTLCVHYGPRLKMAQQKHQKGNHLFSKYSEAKLRKAELGAVATCFCLIQVLPVLTLTLISSKAVRLTMVIVLIFLVSLLNVLFADAVRLTNLGAIAA